MIFKPTAKGPDFHPDPPHREPSLGRKAFVTVRNEKTATDSDHRNGWEAISPQHGPSILLNALGSMADLKQEYERYIADKANLLEKYRGKFIVLKDGEVLGVFDDRRAAVQEVRKTDELGSFLEEFGVESERQVRIRSLYAS